MALSDVFGASFIVSLAICCILVGAVSFLFYNKLQQQSAKISAIMDLTTTLVAEVNVMKNNPSMASTFGMGGIPPAFIPEDTSIHAVKMDIPSMKSSLDPLIEVSEDGDNLSEDEDSESSEDIEDIEELQSDDNEEGDEDDGEEEEEEDEEDEDEEDEDEDEEDEDEDEDIEEIDVDDSAKLNIEDIDEEDSDLGIDVSNLNFEKHAEIHDVISDDKRIIDVGEEIISEINPIPTSSETVAQSKIINIMEPDVTDYGKYTVAELRKIAIARGIIEDGEKPKKTRLIELLSA